MMQLRLTRDEHRLIMHEIARLRTLREAKLWLEAPEGSRRSARRIGWGRALYRLTAWK